MARESRRGTIHNPISLLLVEGETDEIFYNRVKSEILTNIRSTTENLRGLYNINRKIIEKIYRYSNNHPSDFIRVYCCIDRESRDKPPPEFELDVIKKNIQEQSLTKVLSIDSLLANKQIESWFFYDIDNIYRFLRTPRAQRNLNAFNPPSSFGYKNMQRLFERYNKTYFKGRRSGYFIQQLELQKICSDCPELRDGLTLIRNQADSLDNHLFL